MVYWSGKLKFGDVLKSYTLLSNNKRIELTALGSSSTMQLFDTLINAPYNNHQEYIIMVYGNLLLFLMRCKTQQTDANP